MLTDSMYGDEQLQPAPTPKLPETLPELVRECNTAIQAAVDLDAARTQRAEECRQANLKVEGLLHDNAEGTLEDLRGHLARANTLGEEHRELGAKLHRARARATDCYNAAIVILAKNAGLPEGFQARFWAPKIQQMVGEARLKEDISEGSAYFRSKDSDKAETLG